MRRADYGSSRWIATRAGWRSAGGSTPPATRQPSQELEGVEDQVRRAISPPMPELQLDLSVPGHAHAVSRHRRTQGVPAHPFESLPLAGRHDEARMEIEAVRSRMTTAERGRLNRLGRVTQTTDPRAPLPPQRHGAVRGHRRQSSQHRRLVRPRVGLASAVVAIPEAPPLEQAPDARLHRGQHLRHVQRREARGGVNAHDTGAVLREDPRNSTEGSNPSLSANLSRPAHGPRATESGLAPNGAGWRPDGAKVTGAKVLVDRISSRS